MKLFEVYPLFNVTPINAKGSYVWDETGQSYLDLYGGHAVISIGHQHPHYLQKITEQLHHIGFYSNSVQNPLQQELADKLGQWSGYDDYQLFLCNSGAEAIENALKLASFQHQRKKIICFERAFHGRTSGAVAATHNRKIQAPINHADHITYIPFNDVSTMQALVRTGEYCAVLVESIQGVGGIHVTSSEFWEAARSICSQYGTLLIADEIQAGYGRTGKFFGHQYASVKPDLITIAKGMGNGFPIGGVLIHPDIKPWKGMLGTTFGGNHLACAAGIAVLDVLEQEQLISHAAQLGTYLMEALKNIPGVQKVRGQGLMIGMHMASEAKEIRQRLLYQHHIFTGSSSDPRVLRLLPPLNLSKEQADIFLEAMHQVMVHPIA